MARKGKKRQRKYIIENEEEDTEANSKKIQYQDGTTSFLKETIKKLEDYEKNLEKDDTLSQQEQDIQKLEESINKIQIKLDALKKEKKVDDNLKVELNFELAEELQLKELKKLTPKQLLGEYKNQLEEIEEELVEIEDPVDEYDLRFSFEWLDYRRYKNCDQSRERMNKIFASSFFPNGVLRIKGRLLMQYDPYDYSDEIFGGVRLTYYEQNQRMDLYKLVMKQHMDFESFDGFNDDNIHEENMKKFIEQIMKINKDRFPQLDLEEFYEIFCDYIKDKCDEMNLFGYGFCSA